MLKWVKQISIPLVVAFVGDYIYLHRTAVVNREKIEQHAKEIRINTGKIERIETEQLLRTDPVYWSKKHRQDIEHDNSRN